MPADEFEEQKAATLLLRAAEKKDFAVAVETLARLIDNGAANATLFYNYGTALLMANQPGNALEALARAERYSGTTWGIRRNMRLARRTQAIDATTTTLPWQRIPLFWHYQLRATTRLTIAATAFSAIWLLAVFSRGARRHEFLVLATWLAIAVCLLFSASVLASAHAEHNAAIMHAQRQSPEVQP